MKPLVAARTHPEIDHPMGEGRFLSLESLSLFSLLWDPFILTRTQDVAEIYVAGEEIASPSNTLLLYSHPTAEEDAPTVQQVLQAGGRVVLNHPAAELYGSIPELGRAGPAAKVVSLREQWKLGEPASRRYYYPDRQPFQRLNPAGGQVLSWIGDNPDLLLLDNVAVFAGDPWAGVQSYCNMACLSSLLLDNAALLARLISYMAQNPLTARENALLPEIPALRRDFHAFGYAYLTVMELNRCYAQSRIDLSAAAGGALRAAAAVAAGKTQNATELLASAFRELATQNRKLQPTPAVFIDTLHGGGLFADVGYFEFEWPQHAADVLAQHLDWAKTRSYRFNIDFAALSVENMAVRFPKLMSRLKEAQDAGQVEFVNGTFNQPYPPFHSLESQIRQFDTGGAALEKVLGAPVRTFASQEFGFCPQMAAILAQCGYRQVVLRVQNMGDAPTLDAERIWWTAPNGDRIEALPSHPYKTEQRNEVTYNNLHLKLYAHEQSGVQPAVFTGLGDITYYRHFREELARICHYAPVFGSFATWTGYFCGHEANNPKAHRFNMEEFDCRADFLETARWAHAQAYTGNYNTHCTKSMAVSHLCSAGEFLDAVTAGQQSDCSTSQIGWKALATYQGHDNYIVPLHAVGSFMGNDRPGAAVVADYCGPRDPLTLLKRSTDELDEAAHSVEASLRARLRQGIAASANGHQHVLYNFGPAKTQVVSLKGAAGKSLQSQGSVVASQEIGHDLLAQVSLPAYGYCVVGEADSSAAASLDAAGFVQAGADFIENSLVRAEFDLERGTLSRLVRRCDGTDLLLAGGHAFFLPGSIGQHCVSSRVVLQGPLRASLEFDIVVAMKRGKKCLVRSRISLDADRSLLRFEERIRSCPAIEGDGWENHLGVRFALADAEPVWMRSHCNVLEEAKAQHIFSPNLLLGKCRGAEILFVNHGNQFYRRDGAEIAHVLITENEPGREFTYAIGDCQANPIMQARAWVAPCYVERVPRVVGKAGHLVGSSSAFNSFFSIVSDDIEITSCRREGDLFLLRLANTSGREIQTSLCAFRRIDAAWNSDLRGGHLDALTVAQGKANLTLRAWDIRQVAIALEPAQGIPAASV